MNRDTHFPNEGALIRLWQERPCLYDTSLGSFTDRNAKNEAWDEVAAELAVSVAAVMKRTTSLRTQYSRYRKISLSNPSFRPTKRQKWILRKLTFLQPFMTVRSCVSCHQSPSQVPLLDAPELAEAVEQPPEVDMDAHLEEILAASSDSSEEEISATYQQPFVPPLPKRNIIWTKGGSSGRRDRMSSQYPRSHEEAEAEMDLLVPRGAPRLEVDPEPKDKGGDDVYDAFGKYVAHELRRLKDERTRDILRNTIQNDIFRAQMGMVVPQQLVPVTHSVPVSPSSTLGQVSQPSTRQRNGQDQPAANQVQANCKEEPAFLMYNDSDQEI